MSIKSNEGFFRFLDPKLEWIFSSKFCSWLGKILFFTLNFGKFKQILFTNLTHFSQNWLISVKLDSFQSNLSLIHVQIQKYLKSTGRFRRLGLCFIDRATAVVGEAHVSSLSALHTTEVGQSVKHWLNLRNSTVCIFFEKMVVATNNGIQLF